MRITNKKTIQLCQIVAAPIAFGIAGLLLLAVAFLLPTERIRSHVEDSAIVLAQETDYFSVTQGIEGAVVDNYTEALYLNEALIGVQDTSLADCILSGNIFQAPSENVLPVGNLLGTLSDPEGSVLRKSEYRFFNGYEIFVKSLLLITNYAGIRQLNLYLSFFLTLWLFALMIKRGFQSLVIPICISLLFIHPLTIALCMTFVGFYYCMIIPCLLFLSIDKETLQKKAWLYFEITGALVFYFNMNYFQLLSFGMPLIFYFLIVGIPDNPLGLAKKVGKLFACWFIGYAGMMAFKWLMYAVFIDHSIFLEMLGAVLFRTGTDRGSRLLALVANMNEAIQSTQWLILELIYLAFCVFKWKKSKVNPRLSPSTVVLLIIMTLFPIVRYMLFANHVIIHRWVTYRLLMLPIMTFNILITNAGNKDGLVNS